MAFQTRFANCASTVATWFTVRDTVAVETLALLATSRMSTDPRCEKKSGGQAHTLSKRRKRSCRGSTAWGAGRQQQQERNRTESDYSAGWARPGFMSCCHQPLVLAQNGMVNVCSNLCKYETGVNMPEGPQLSRRQFIGAGISAAVSSLHSSPVLVLSREDTANAGDWKDAGVLFVDKSPYAKLHNIPVRAVTITPGFWGARRETNVDKSIPSMEKLLEANGRMDNFLRLVGKSDAAQRGPVYSDSDVYKWTEAVGFVLQSGDRPDLRAMADKIIKEVVAVQEPSGYLNTYYVGERAKDRMEPEVQRSGHELYNVGHMIQGAIAYYRATGDRTLLDAAVRFIDDYLLPNFGPGPEKKPILSGHPEIELALVELYRTLGDKRHLDLAGYILQGDDRIKLPRRAYVYHFCGIPFTSRTHLEGHAVRAMYACCGAADYYLETGDQSYWKTLNLLWEDLVSSQMYITGGVGARSQGEAFGDSYELPNFTAYGESCAAIGNMMWNWRMLAATSDAKFADVIERALYNGINSGMSLDGTLYCYRNPLAFDPSGGDQIRNSWYDTTCCPPNLERTFASLPGYFYSTSGDGLYLHLYDNSELNWHLENGTGLRVVQKTNYPWDGAAEITLTPSKPDDFTFYLRIPGWSADTQVTINGKPVAGVTAGHYLGLRRRWEAGDVIRVSFDMTPQIVEASDRVVEDYGRVAVQRGPLVYCLEQIDQPEGVALFDVYLDLRQASSSSFQAEFRRETLGGIVVLKHTGTAYERPRSRNALYHRYTRNPPKGKPVQLTFVPYYAWANRAATPMQVWTPIIRS
ncbi:MAG: glycoside hydrolase family 127 protein [Acidobacteria bacterium]|nr:MAG: glycoside hydrolase family 127 protein [Acidobacteriota bacterium]